MNSFTKQPSEKFPISVNLENVLGVETIASITVTAYDSDGNDVTSTIIDSTDYSDTAVTAIVKNGTTSNKYKITFKATTSRGYIYEEDISMVVNEI